MEIAIKLEPGMQQMTDWAHLNHVDPWNRMHYMRLPYGFKSYDKAVRLDLQWICRYSNYQNKNTHSQVLMKGITPS